MLPRGRIVGLSMTQLRMVIHGDQEEASPHKVTCYGFSFFNPWPPAADLAAVRGKLSNIEVDVCLVSESFKDA